MVFLLVFYVFNNGVFFFDVVREGTISLLPAAKQWKKGILLYPKATGKFNVFDQISKSNRGMKVRENVQVVFGAIDAIESALMLINNPPDVLVQFFAVRFCNCFLAVFGAEDDLVKDLAVRTHRSSVWTEKIQYP